MGSDLRVIVDHLSGSRRGQRDEIEASDKIRFGRHPDSEVRFDAQRDLDVSTRHAELRREGDSYVLCDVGSSNGTLVDGEPIGERLMSPGNSLLVQLGAGGPRLQIFVADGEHADPPERTPAPAATARSRALVTATVIAVLLALALSALIWAR